LGLADGNHMRRDMEEAARLASLDFKVDFLVNSRAQVVDVYAGDFVKEHRAGLAKARQIWMTKMAPADIYVLYPGEGAEKHLSSSFFIRIEGADLGVKDDGIIIMALSGTGGWASSEARTPGMHSMAGTEGLFKEGTEAITRAMVRRDGNVRTLSMLFTARRVLERRRVWLVSDGMKAQEAKDFGFEYCASRFEDALKRALNDRGRDARAAVNIVQYPVAWRAMPWREG
ncbi:MAG: hypothetical protein Q8O76_07530, partial [Chloroflexota bacterium]|nr:hypothetical protein [Chloroflexota bacterium]